MRKVVNKRIGKPRKARPLTWKEFRFEYTGDINRMESLLQEWGLFEPEVRFYLEPGLSTLETNAPVTELRRICREYEIHLPREYAILPEGDPAARALINQ